MKKEEIKKQLLKEIESLKDKRGFINAGFPRFNQLFGRDSLISAWQLLDIDPKICRNTLEILSKFQGKRIDRKRAEEPGKILHEHQIGSKKYPEGYFFFPYYGTVDATPLFLILFSFYFEKTKDKKFLKEHWQNLTAAIDWVLNYGDMDRDGFLEYQRRALRDLFHQGWKDGFFDHLKIRPPVAIVEVQGYKYLALKEIAKIAAGLGKNSFAKKLAKEAQNLKKNFNQKFWMKDKKYFALALDGKKEQRKAICSNPGHLLFTGIVEKDKIGLVVKRLFQKDLWTSFGVRTHSEKEQDFDPRSYHLGSIWPHDNWMIAQGLKKLGYYKEYNKIKTALLAAFKEIGFIPENYGVVNKEVTVKMKKRPCHPQAWASGALLNFLF